MKMPTLFKRNSALMTPLLNERGSSQIIAYAACAGIIFALVLFGVEVSKYVATVSAQSNLADSIMRDSMRIHNGLTPQTVSYLTDRFQTKGYNLSRLSITGTPAGMPFGSELEGQIRYDYQLPIFTLINSFYPSVTVSTTPIVSNVHVYALGVVR